MLGTAIKWVAAKPKLVVTVLVVVALGAHFTHYKYLQGKVTQLTVEKSSLSQALGIAQQAVRDKDEALALEREATALVTSERNRARRALDAFRAGRDDAESVQWAAQSVPQAERDRMCQTLPELSGCPNTPLSN